MKVNITQKMRIKCHFRIFLHTDKITSLNYLDINFIDDLCKEMDGRY